MVSRFRLGKALPDKVDLARFERAQNAEVTLEDSGLAIVTPTTAGAYAAAIPLFPHADSHPSTVFVEIDATMTEGAIAFHFASPDMRRGIGTPMRLASGQSGPLRYSIRGIQDAYWMLIRNDGPDGQAASLRLDAVRFFSADAETLPKVAEVAAGRIGYVDIAGMASVADAVENPTISLSTIKPVTIDSVSVELLGQRLGFSTGFDPARASRKPLTAWRMEDDDQPIFRYLYRQARPRRHLEFGTWHGAGTVYCLQECDATVWTINLPDGERASDGRAAYNQTDSGTMIGRLYLETGFGHRVCQIFSDTRTWDTRNYPPGFFDSVLIDGGHQADVVVSDTLKAIELLRPGGLCMWHDFAPDPEVFSVSPATIGVAQGIARIWPQIAAAMSDVFYIWPSQILVGIRR